MKTLHLSTSLMDIKTAASLLQSGELVVFPTETVYGLGAAADNAVAIGKVFEAKNRPSDNPLIVHVDSIDMAREYAEELSAVERDLFEAFSPGPFTLITRRKGGRAEGAAAGGESIGLRIPSDTAALSLIREVGGGIAAPSANRSGRPSPTDFSMACAEMDGRVAAIIDGGPSVKGLESTIVTHKDNKLWILRPGSIDRNAIASMMPTRGGIEVQRFGVTESSDDLPKAPGTRYRHYAPGVKVRLYSRWEDLTELLASDSLSFRDPGQTSVICILPMDHFLSRLEEQSRPPGIDFPKAVSPIYIAGFEDYAHRLYRIFTDSESNGVSEIWCWFPPDSALSAALRDRLTRAAQG